MRKGHYIDYRKVAANNTKYYVDGKSLRQVAEESGVSYDTLLGRWKRGLRTYEELTNTEGCKNAEFMMECATAKGRRLLKSIERSGMNMTEVSKRSGVARSVIWNFCHNDSDMSSDRLFSVCDTVKCSMDYVMGLCRS